jgi:hypothetical protein
MDPDGYFHDMNDDKNGNEPNPNCRHGGDIFK